MSKNTLELKSMFIEQLHRADHWEERALRAEQSVEAFMTGDIPMNASFQTVLLAMAGRKRLDALRNKPALLQGNS